jgi:tetratricopeptide (TPR) repeat protein
MRSCSRRFIATKRHTPASGAALELDPLSPYVNSSVGLVLVNAGRGEEAIAPVAKALEMDGGFPYSYWVLAGAHARSGRHEEAVRVLEKAVLLSERSSFYLSALASACGVAGRRADAERLTAPSSAGQEALRVLEQRLDVSGFSRPSGQAKAPPCATTERAPAAARSRPCTNTTSFPPPSAAPTTRPTA